MNRQRLAWQQDAWQRIDRWLQTERLPHALLLTGIQGTGKAYLARQLASRLLCQQPDATAACGKCHSCHLLAAGHHPDYHHLSPEGDSRQIRIDPVRQLIDTLSQTAQMGRWRITVIEPAEQLNTNAANALLKTLEEPGAGNLIMLLSHFPGLLPATLRSRCQVLSLAAPSAEQAASWMHTHHPEAIEALAFMPDRPFQALQLVADGNSEEGLQRWQQRLEQWQALCQGRLSPLALAALWQQQSMADLLLWLRLQIASQLRQHWLQAQASSGYRQWLEFDQQLLQLQRQLLAGANPNPQLLWEDLLLQASRISAD